MPFEVSGRCTAEAIDGSKLVLVKDAPHGLSVIDGLVLSPQAPS